MLWFYDALISDMHILSHKFARAHTHKHTHTHTHTLMTIDDRLAFN